jgi:hypothetical protein
MPLVHVLLHAAMAYADKSTRYTRRVTTTTAAAAAAAPTARLIAAN